MELEIDMVIAEQNFAASRRDKTEAAMNTLPLDGPAMTTSEIIEVLAAFEAKKTIQWYGPGGLWGNFSQENDRSILLRDLANGYRFRVQPQPKMIALDASDFVGRCVWLRLGEGKLDTGLVIRASHTRVLVADGWDGWISYERLRELYSYTTDGITWNKCEKEAD